MSTMIENFIVWSNLNMHINSQGTFYTTGETFKYSFNLPPANNNLYCKRIYSATLRIKVMIIGYIFFMYSAYPLM